MTKVIVIGHAGYGTAIKNSLAMLVGEIENYSYIDFNEQDDLDVLKRRITDTISSVGESDVLFCCDVAGGTPFRIAAVICTEHKNFCCVAGINISAYSEISFNTEMCASELADMAVNITKDTVIRFPED